jgi:hypothetical protein
MTPISPQATALSRSSLAQHIMRSIEGASRCALGGYLLRQGSFAPPTDKTSTHAEALTERLTPSLPPAIR